MRGLAAILALACIALAGCKQPLSEGSASVAGSTDVVVRSTRIFRADVGSGSSSQAYYVVCELTFTNDLGHDVIPAPKNFVFYDAYGQPYPGVDTGAAALIGVSNYSDVVKKDEKRDYTIGFRVPSVTSGAVFYAPS